MQILRLLKSRPWGTVGAIILLVLVLIAALAPVIAPYHFNEISITSRFQPPGGSYILGTDNLGRDVFSRALYGARPYVEAGLIATGTAIVIGILLGFVSRFFSRKTDYILRIILFSLSIIVWLIMLAQLVSIAMRFLPFSIHFINDLTNILRTENTELMMEHCAIFTGLLLSLILLPATYSLSRETFTSGNPGKSMVTLLFSFPVYLGIAAGAAVLLIVPAGFYGFGVPPPLPEWGNMLSGTGRQYMLEAPRMWQTPLISIGVTILGFILFTSATVEIWMPRLNESASTD